MPFDVDCRRTFNVSIGWPHITPKAPAIAPERQTRTHVIRVHADHRPADPTCYVFCPE